MAPRAAPSRGAPPPAGSTRSKSGAIRKLASRAQRGVGRKGRLV